MKKALIICAAGMSSSMMASKTTDFFKAKRRRSIVDAVSATEGDNMIKNSDFDLFLISPQTTMFLDKFKKLGESVGNLLLVSHFKLMSQFHTGIQKLAEVIEEKYME